jgi:glycogen phosphorylase
VSPSAPAPASTDGTADIHAAGAALAERLPGPLQALGHAAYDLRWSWQQGGEDAFRRLDPDRWAAAGRNPVRFLRDLPPDVLERGAAGAPVRTAPGPTEPAALDTRVAFFCAEFALHAALRLYSGGLGVLAGDICKEASDLGVPLLAVGLLYRQGFFQQRLDVWGRQHEYWVPLDTASLPLVRVRDADGDALVVTLELRGRTVAAAVWRTDVGRVPLYLLDTDLPDNHPIDRWITARLYVSDRSTRLAQYGVLGIGGMRALRAMGLEPDVVHLNEGHAALAPLEMTRAGQRDVPFSAALRAAGERTVFTTHTPVPAGNETYKPEEVRSVLGDYPAQLGLEPEAFLDLGRARRRRSEPFGMTVLGLRASGWANGVSARHGAVARRMWKGLYGVPAARVPIRHVTNGVHLPTWLRPPLRELLDGYLGAGWTARAAEPDTWAAVERIPDAELWAVRCRLRADLVTYVRDRSVRDRLGRGEPDAYVAAAADSFDPGVLTLGFARRVATYKRLRLLTLDPPRALAMLEGARPVQLLVAGKAHPADEEAKGVLQHLFGLKNAPHVANRVAFLEDYDLDMAAVLTGGCDIWVNLPRPPLEASGTSGMKSALNGGLNLSVLDGWWPEAYDGENGWALPGDVDEGDPAQQDARDAAAFYALMENEIVPLYYERDAAGLPSRWLRRVRRALQTVGPAFAATRMVTTYRDEGYRL